MLGGGSGALSVDDADPVFDTKEAEERLRWMLGDILAVGKRKALPPKYTTVATTNQ